MSTQLDFLAGELLIRQGKEAGYEQHHDFLAGELLIHQGKEADFDQPI